MAKKGNFLNKVAPQFTHLKKVGSKLTSIVSVLHSGQFPVTICDVKVPIFIGLTKECIEFYHPHD